MPAFGHRERSDAISRKVRSDDGIASMRSQ